MSQCLGSSLENDIRLHASGSEKVVFAQRNPLAEMYPNAVFRNFEQEKVDECLEVSRQRSQLAAHIVFCRACASFMMSLEPRNGSLARVASSRLMVSRREICPGSTPRIGLLRRRQRSRSNKEVQVEAATVTEAVLLVRDVACC